MSNEKKIEEQLLSQAIETTVSNQLDNVEEINIDIQTDLFKLFQGQAEGISLEGEGLVMQDVRVEKLELQTDNVEINPLSAIFGKVELNHPVNANARVVFTEADINQAANSTLFRQKFSKLDLNVNGNITALKLESIQIYFPENGKLKVTGKVQIQQHNTSLIGFEAVVHPRSEEKPIIIERFVCTEGEGFSLDLIAAFMQKIEDLMQLPYLKLEDFTFRIKKMVVEKGRITMLIQVLLKKIPAT
ncbi:LmeA family phospholipid-binding protein [Brunnivagina elsteri]|uniref:DUF2993 domain-containing protein n=1 Tax=Brunnivagina elsteri CCALA 953 TaxID=987040 RepID=A0A2A2TPX4_9CYAN|nr:DUF2993 domain-containing protein [Calothrix elsteri]PAX60483.1 hypothetical protein CK510_01675 [Calothrix elsteri CCALA 953]